MGPKDLMVHSPLYDCRSTTGRNFRKLMLLLNKTSVSDISKDDFKTLTYNAAPSSDEWKIQFAKEIIRVKHNELEIENFKYSEIDEMLEHILT